jgi:hypothetical protein
MRQRKSSFQGTSGQKSQGQTNPGREGGTKRVTLWRQLC